MVSIQIRYATTNSKVQNKETYEWRAFVSIQRYRIYGVTRNNERKEEINKQPYLNFQVGLFNFYLPLISTYLNFYIPPKFPRTPYAPAPLRVRARERVRLCVPVRVPVCAYACACIRVSVRAYTCARERFDFATFRRSTFWGVGRFQQSATDRADRRQRWGASNR